MPQLYELDEFAPPQFLGFVRSVPEPNEYQGQRWLPNQTIDDLSFEYVLGSFRRPVMAHIMGFDSEAPIAGRPGAGASIRGELPPVKRKKKIGEKELIKFMQPRAGSADQQTAIDQTYVDTADLIDSIFARAEWLRLQALSESTVVYDEAGVKFEFDFGVNPQLQFDLVAGTNGEGTTISGLGGDWADPANSNPVTALKTISRIYRKVTGRTLQEYGCSQTTIDQLYSNEQIRGLIRGANAPTAILAQQEIDTLFRLYGLPTLVPYDVTLQNENEDGTYEDVRPLAENKGFAVPANYGATNKTLWGPTAESRALIGTRLAQQAPGVWAGTYQTEEPPAQWIKAAAVLFPSQPEANHLVQVSRFYDPATLPD